MACRLPLYDPISFSLLMFSCTCLLASVSIVICDNSAVSEVTVLGVSEPILARLWIEYLAMMRVEVVGPRA